MNQTSNSVVIQAKNPDQVARLGDWCRNNLSQTDYDFEVVTMFPLWINFKIHCPKQRMLAILST